MNKVIVQYNGNIQTSGSHTKGSNNAINGSRNKVKESNNVINGNNNDISGFGNISRGTYNNVFPIVMARNKRKSRISMLI